MEYEIQNCAICGFRAKTPRGFATHIRSHKIDKLKYIELFGEYATVVIDDNKLRCPICGLPNFENVKIHMKHIHKLSDEEIAKYPEERLVLPSYRENAGKGGKKTHMNFIAKHPGYIPYKPKFKSRSEASKSLWQNEEYRKAQSDKCKKQHQKGLTERVLHRRSKFIYKESIYMRSSWEIRVAEYMDSNNISWKYEGACIYYTNPRSNKKCRYFPDFILDNNIAIEVKPEALQIDDIVIAKKKAAEDSGYVFKFLGEEALDNLDEYFNNLV